MLANGLDTCNCKRKQCERFGNCEACIEHHKTHKRYKLPYCLRKEEAKMRKRNKGQASKNQDETNR